MRTGPSVTTTPAPEPTTVTTSPAGPGSSRARWWSERSTTAKFLIAIAPALLLYGGFVVYPMAHVVVASFTDAQGFNRPVSFIGLENFARIFTGDDLFLQVLRNTGIYAFFKVVVQTIAAFFIAVLLHRQLLLGNIYRAIFFAPMVISPVAVVFTWSFMYDPASGTINELLRMIGLGSLTQDWLGNYDLALYSVIVVDLWSGLGFNIVIFLAGLSTIPTELLDAGRVDGATGWKTVRYITIPLMVPAIGLVLVLAINGALRAFDTVYLMTNGGPGNSTQLYMTQVFHEGLVRNNFGYASAMAVLVIIVLIGIAITQQRLNARLATGEETR